MATSQTISVNTDGSGEHLRHIGFSGTITDSYASPVAHPEGISGDGTNVISVTRNIPYHTHYKHSGFSSTITSSYSSPAIWPSGITWDGSNVISADEFADKHYKHSGFSSTITSSYSSPSSTPTGITWDGSNVISADNTTDKHYKHSGFSSTITSSYSSPSSTPTGITWDGSNVISADSDVYSGNHYKHRGFSGTITKNYVASAKPRGVTWQTVAPTNYYTTITLTQNLTITAAALELNTTYTTVPIVRKRLKDIDPDITDSDIEQYIWEAEGIIDATMKDSLLTIFTATKHDLIRACATDLAALQILTYDPSAQSTIEAAAMTADLLLASTKDALEMLSNPRNVKYWKSL